MLKKNPTHNFHHWKKEKKEGEEWEEDLKSQLRDFLATCLKEKKKHTQKQGTSAITTVNINMALPMQLPSAIPAAGNPVWVDQHQQKWTTIKTPADKQSLGLLS